MQEIFYINNINSLVDTIKKKLSSYAEEKYKLKITDTNKYKFDSNGTRVIENNNKSIKLCNLIHIDDFIKTVKENNIETLNYMNEYVYFRSIIDYNDFQTDKNKNYYKVIIEYNYRLIKSACNNIKEPKEKQTIKKVLNNNTLQTLIGYY
jgi:hypothetical protein